MSTPILHVAQVITSLELGGAQISVLRLAERLDRRRFRVSLLHGPGGRLADEAGRLRDVDVHVVPALGRDIHPTRDPLAGVQLWRLMRRLAPDVVHTHTSKAGILGRWSAALAGVPVRVHTMHGIGIVPDQPVWLRATLAAVERATAPVTSHAVAVADVHRELALRRRWVRPGAVSTVRAGVDLGAIAPLRAATAAGTRADPRRRAREALGLPADAFVVLALGALRPQKRPELFVRLAAKVRAATRRPVAFAMVGDGPSRPDVEAVIAETGTADVVHLLGFHADVVPPLAAADALVLTSAWEGLPCVVPEAMAAGLPVVAFDVDGIREAVTEGVTGHLVPYGDLDALAARVVALVDDPDRAAALGAEGARRVDPFDVDTMVAELGNLYEALWRKHGGRAARVAA